MIDPSPAPRHRRTVLRFGRSQAGAEKRAVGRHAARLPVESPLAHVEPPTPQAEPPVAQLEPQVEPPVVPTQAPVRQPEIYCWS